MSALFNVGLGFGGSAAHATETVTENAPVPFTSMWGGQFLFETATNGHVLMRHSGLQTPSALGWVDLGSPFQSTTPFVAQPSVTSDGVGIIHVYAVDSQGVLWSRQQRVPDASGGSWAPYWVPLGFPSDLDFTGRPLAMLNADMRVQLFVRENNTGWIYSSWQTGTGSNSGWTPWTPLFAEGTLPSCRPGSAVSGGYDRYHRMHIFVINACGQLETTYQDSANGSWYAWETIGAPSDSYNGWPTGLIGQPTVLSRAGAQDVLQVFAVGQDRAVYSVYSNDSSGGSWSKWVSLGGWQLGSDVSAEFGAHQQVTVFVRGGNGAIYSQQQTANDVHSPWGGWRYLGGNVSGQPAVGKFGNQQLQVFVAGGDTATWSKWQDQSLNFGGWAYLAGSIMA